MTNCDMQFEIEESRNHWVIAGQRRGTFKAIDGLTIPIYLTLVPLHHGELSLPRINISPIQPRVGLTPPSSFCVQGNGASRILILPQNSRSTFVLEMTSQSEDLFD